MTTLRFRFEPVPRPRRDGKDRVARPLLAPLGAHGTVPLLVVLALAAAAGCAKKQQQHFAMPPMPVETAEVVQAPVVDRFETVGTIEAGEAITVVSEIDGLVDSIPFREGEETPKGRLILKLDDQQLGAEVARAEALRDQSQVTYDRIKSVVDQGAGAPQDLDDAAAALKVAQANLRLARSRLDKTRIAAPWGGILGARRVSPGAFLRAGQAITDLAHIQEIKVTFSAPERYISSLHRGAEVSVSTTAYPGYALIGKIDVVEPVLDASLRSARILARVSNPGGKFRPGMSANVTAVLGERQNALTIPNEAVFVEGSQSFVFVVKADSTVTRSALTLGTRQSDVVEVLQGLAPGMRVVRAGHQKLFEGAKVMPIPHQETPPAAGAAAGGAAVAQTVATGSTAGGAAPAAAGGAVAAPAHATTSTPQTSADRGGSNTGKKP